VFTTAQGHGQKLQSEKRRTSDPSLKFPVTYTHYIPLLIFGLCEIATCDTQNCDQKLPLI
jgi:hypothetical protein